MDKDRLLTIREAAAYLNVRPSLVYQWSAQGKLPGKVTLGRRTVRVDKLILEEWLAKKTAPGSSREVAIDVFK